MRERLDQVTNRYKNKRLRYAQNKARKGISNFTLNWTEAERIALYFMEISEIKRLLYRRPSRDGTTVFKPETVRAYWDELMNRMPEGRDPEYKPA